MRKFYLLLLCALYLSACSLRKSTYIQTVEVAYTKVGMKISPVGKAVKADTTNLPEGRKIDILIKR